MIWASMDIGTNSCRLLLAETDASGGITVLKRMLRTTRIGQGMNREMRRINEKAKERTLQALEEFAQEISAYPQVKIRLVATQAVRMAENSAELVCEIREKLGWDLEIISGEREALLSYSGAVKGLTGLNRPLVIDIGGGSTEFIAKTGADGLASVSLPLGALRLLENPLSHNHLDRFFQNGLKEIPFGPDVELVGVGGTCTTAAAAYLGLKEYDAVKVQGCKLTRTAVEELYARLSALSPRERSNEPGIFPGREDIIVYGLEILMIVMGYFQQEEITVSDQDLLYGLIYEASNEVIEVIEE